MNVLDRRLAVGAFDVGFTEERRVQLGDPEGVLHFRTAEGAVGFWPGRTAQNPAITQTFRIADLQSALLTLASPKSAECNSAIQKACRTVGR